MSSINQFITPESPESTDHADQSNFDFSEDCFTFDDAWLEDFPDQPGPIRNNPVNYQASDSAATTSTLQGQPPAAGEINESNVRDQRREGRERYAFKTKSEVEVLDDGYRWRKYGKKKVKNSPNPRNYYRCSVEGCPVKKRVERDKEDPSFVITTYEGIHNHQITTSTS